MIIKNYEICVNRFIGIISIIFTNIFTIYMIYEYLQFFLNSNITLLNPLINHSIVLDKTLTNVTYLVG